MAEVKLHPDWLAAIGGEFAQPYMAALKAFLSAERDKDKVIYPQPRDWFAALDATPPQDARVVILGQDPYHGPGQAHGLCFSVQPGMRVPPSLVNIYKEMQSDIGIPRASHGYLGHWAEQGVLLLNTCLTVEAGQAASHQGGVASGQGVGEVHRRRRRGGRRRPGAEGFHPVGQPCPEEGGGCCGFGRGQPASDPARAASLALVGSQRLFRVAAVQPGE